MISIILNGNIIIAYKRDLPLYKRYINDEEKNYKLKIKIATNYAPNNYKYKRL